MKNLYQMIRSSRFCVVFTGAGISTLSGIPDFRSPNGVYSRRFQGYPVEEILSIDLFLQRPDLYYSWAKPFIYELDRYQPNIVHRTVAGMERAGLVGMTYTQNIDLLHERAGSRKLGELHGSPAVHDCLQCGKTFEYPQIAAVVQRGEVPKCPLCGGIVKPRIVFYGEALDADLLSRAERDLRKADLLLVLGSSLTVNPAAMLPELTLSAGGKLVIVNRQPTPLDAEASLRFDDLETVFSGLQKELLRDFPDCMTEPSGNSDAQSE